MMVHDPLKPPFVVLWLLAVLLLVLKTLPCQRIVFMLFFIVHPFVSGLGTKSNLFALKKHSEIITELTIITMGAF